jgi:hypothetical protein
VVVWLGGLLFCAAFGVGFAGDAAAVEYRAVGFAFQIVLAGVTRSARRFFCAGLVFLCS